MLISFFAVTLALAADRCDFETLTDKCRKFGAKGSYKIELPDGTFIPNIAALEEGAKAMQGQGDAVLRQKSAANSAAEENRALDAMEILEEIPSQKMSNRLKFWLGNRLETVQELTTDSYRESTVRLPWPPEDSSAKLQAVPTAEASQRLREIVGEDRTDRLTKLGRGPKMKEMVAAVMDSFRDRHPLFDEMNTIPPERASRVKELVEFARQEVVDSISGGKPEFQWTPDESALIKKVRGIRYVAGDSPTLQTAIPCMGIAPNAYYEADSHSINICAGFYRYPDLTLVGVLAHEMTHAIDVCAAQFPYYAINPTKLAELSANAIPYELVKDGDLKDIYEKLKKVTKDGANVTAFPFGLVLEDQKSLAYFEERGVLLRQSENHPFKQTGNKIEGYVFADVYACLLGDAKANLRQVTDEQIERVVKVATERRRAVSGLDYDAKADAARIRRAFKKYPQCLSPDASTQMREAISDVNGSRAEGAFVKEKKVDTPTQRLATVAFFASLVCQARGTTASATDKDAPALTVSQAKGVVAAERDAHPGDKVRIERIFLTDPNLRAAMGCGPAPTRPCGHKPPGLAAGSQNQSESHR